MNSLWQVAERLWDLVQAALFPWPACALHVTDHPASLPFLQDRRPTPHAVDLSALDSNPEVVFEYRPGPIAGYPRFYLSYRHQQVVRRAREVATFRAVPHGL